MRKIVIICGKLLTCPSRYQKLTPDIQPWCEIIRFGRVSQFCITRKEIFSRFHTKTPQHFAHDMSNVRKLLYRHYACRYSDLRLVPYTMIISTLHFSPLSLSFFLLPLSLYICICIML